MEKQFSVTKNLVMVHVEFAIVYVGLKRLRGRRRTIESLPFGRWILR